jgi:prepilin-type N-terminal cleavage/methylation domain-containing protein
MRIASRHRLGSAGFSLIEILVAMVILALILVFVVQMTGGTSKSTSFAVKRLDADAQARLIFDRMAVDFTRMARASDMDYEGKGNPASKTMPGNDQIAFFSAVPGYYTAAGTPPLNATKHLYSLVGYTVSTGLDLTPRLVRLAKGLSWETTDAIQDITFLPGIISLKWPSLWTRSTTEFSGMEDTDFQAIGSSVVRMEYAYLLQATSTGSGSLSISPFLLSQAGHTPTDFYRDVAGIVVTLAIVDAKSRVMISDYTKITSNTVFPDAEEETSLDNQWNTVIEAPDFAANAGIPRAAASAVRIYQRTFYLNPSPS